MTNGRQDGRVHGMSGPVRVAMEGSSFWMDRTRGGCGVTLGADDLVLRERELPVSGVVRGVEG